MSTLSSKSKSLKYSQREPSNSDLSSGHQKNTTVKFKKSMALEQQITKMFQKMNQCENQNSKVVLRKTLQNAKTTKEDKDFHKSLLKVKANQKHLQNNLIKTKSSNKNPNNYFSKNQHLPKTLAEIDDNIELARLLLKNPEKMTEEEKIYIASFTDREFKLFIDYLKMKDREIKWQGNGYGSGHYLEGLKSIYRNFGGDANERYARLRKLLGVNRNTKKNKDKKNNMWGEEGDFKADENANLVQIDDYRDTTMKKYEDRTKELEKEMEIFNGIIDKQRNETNFIKFQNKNKFIKEDLNRKKKLLEEDIANLKKMKNSTNEIDELFKRYVNDYFVGGYEFDNKFSIGYILKEYLNVNHLTSLDLAIRLAEIGSSSDIQKNFINIDKAEKKFIEMKIFKEEESKQICEILRRYNGESIRVDIFAMFIDKEIEEEIEVLKKKQLAKLEEEEEKDNYFLSSYGLPSAGNENLFEDDDSNISYDDIKPKFTTIDTKIVGLRKKIEGKYFNELDQTLKNKYSIVIQKMYKAHLTRRRVNSEKIYRYILAKRICKLFRKYYIYRMKLKNEAAKKITYLLRKNYWKNKDLKSLSTFSSRWLKKKTNINIETKKNLCASLIQYRWKVYKKRRNKLIKETKTEMRKDLLKSKLCFICQKMVVAYLCRECKKNHYCERCFRKFHMRGVQKNHNYIEINDLFRQNQNAEERIRLDPSLIDKREMIKQYFKESGNKISLYEKLRGSSTVKNGGINYFHLKNIIDKEIDNERSDIKHNILEYALNYIVEGNKNKRDSCYIDIRFARDFILH